MFTALIRGLGVRGLEVTEIYDIEPWATDHLKPYGLILCYPFGDDEENESKDTYDDSSLDPDAENIWFAYQLSSDTCASQAVLNVVLNLKDIETEDELKTFSSDTSKMDPVVSNLTCMSSSTECETNADTRPRYHKLSLDPRSAQFPSKVRTYTVPSIY